MAVNTLLLNFRFGGAPTLPEIEKIAVDGLEQQRNFEPNALHRIFTDGASLTLFKGPRETLMTLRLYAPQNLATVTIEYFLPSGKEPILTYEDCKVLEAYWSMIADFNEPKNVKTLPRILRGMPFDVYFPTTDERLMEYDVEEVCFDGRSEFQHIQIFKTKSFGKMLILDDDPNLAESDRVYTENLMRRGIEKYENSEILILGGGDGVLLWELLKEKPKKVVMLEIDEMVMNACKEHLRSLCGSGLDQLTGTNYEILTGDCLPIMTDMLQEGLRFDFVFGDLTTIPISEDTSSGNLHNFMSAILQASFQILRPGGKFMTHAPGTSGPESARLLEDLIQSQGHLTLSALEISKETAFVPSFAENWAFYAVQITPKK